MMGQHYHAFIMPVVTVHESQILSFLQLLITQRSWPVRFVIQERIREVGVLH